MGLRPHICKKTIAFPEDFKVKSLCSKRLESGSAYPASFLLRFETLENSYCCWLLWYLLWAGGWAAAGTLASTIVWFLLVLGEQTGQLTLESIEDCPGITYLFPVAREMVILLQVTLRKDVQ